MKSEVLHISISTDFNRLKIDKDVYKLSIIWAADIPQQEKNYKVYSVKNFLGTINYNYPFLRILDISLLDGIEQLIMHGKTLSELYCSDSTSSVIVNIEDLRKISAPGAKSIRVNDTPNLREVEYSVNLEQLDLDNTGITTIDLSFGTKLASISFKNCKKLKQIEIPDTVRLDGNNFEGCDNLEEVILSNNILVISPNVFKDCKNLRTIKGGLKIKQLFPSSIQGCSRLEYIEAKNFINYSDLSISDKKWFEIEKSHPLSVPSFIQVLRKKKIDDCGAFFADNYIGNRIEKHVGILIHFIVGPWLWIIWSLNHNRYFLSTSIYDNGIDDDIRRNLRKGTLVEFEYNDTPLVFIEESIFLQQAIRRIDLHEITILSSNDVYSKIIEYYNPSVALINRYLGILELIDNVNLSSVINSYTIKTGVSWQRRVGKDDIERYYRVASSNYSDAYIEKLLPQEEYQGDSSGCAPWGAEEEAERETISLQKQANIDAEKIKSTAKTKYSKIEHICTLLEEYMKERTLLEKNVEEGYHLKQIEDFVLGFHGWDRPDKIAKLYNITLKDILDNTNPIFWQD